MTVADTPAWAQTRTFKVGDQVRVRLNRGGTFRATVVALKPKRLDVRLGQGGSIIERRYTEVEAW